MYRKHDETRFKIGELAGRLGLSVTALRYYESIGVLPPPERTKSGYRLYTETEARLLRFVLQAKRAGLTLEEIRRIIRSGKDGAEREDVLESLQRRIASIDAEVAELQQFRQALAATVRLPPEVPDQLLARDLIERLASLPPAATGSAALGGIRAPETPSE